MSGDERQRTARDHFLQLVSDFEAEIEATKGTPYENRVVRAAAFLKKCKDEDALEQLQTLFTCFLGSFIEDDAMALLMTKEMVS